MSVKHILSLKGHTLVTAIPTETVQVIAERLAKNKIGAILVVHQDSQDIAGIVSERDVVRLLAQMGAAAIDKPVSTIMTTHVKVCEPEDTEAELMALMTQHRIRHLPVVENGKPAGMISIGDVVKFRIEAIEREAEDMKSYIASAG